MKELKKFVYIWNNLKDFPDVYNFADNMNRKINGKNYEIKNFLKQLRESDELMIKIFNSGSCYKLTKILKSIYPEARALYSQKDGHWITEIGDKYYDIGGKISRYYVIDKCYEYSPEFEASADIPTYSNDVGVSYSKYK